MKFQVQELRPEVLAFALLMEARLREKDADKGQRWKERHLQDLRVSLLSKVRSLDDTLIVVPFIANKHAVDLANFCMMIADVSGALNIPEEESYEWVRDDESTFDVFMLIDKPGVTREVIASWTNAQCKQAEAWAMLTHFSASDNNVTVPPAPDFIAPLLVK